MLFRSIVALAGFFLMKGGNGGGGNLPVGDVTKAGNSSPFGPGGKANSEFGGKKGPEGRSSMAPGGNAGGN